MKKILTILLFFVAVSASAQHLKFMGIPLDGSIANFHSRLIAKGLTPEKEFNATSPVGSRMFNGSFCGYKSDFFVYYNPKTKIVYRSKAVIDDRNLENIERAYKEIKDMINEKYKDAYSKDYFGGEHRSIRFFLMKEGTTAWDLDNSQGTIDLYITEQGEYFYKTYFLHIDYIDRINSEKNQSSNSNDL